MKVAIFNGAGKPITIEERPDEDVGPADVRINISRCGICGSDVSMTSGSTVDYEVGRAIGHEFAGEVIEAGALVTKFKVGDRLASIPSGACGTCAMCLAGRPLYCMSGRNLFGGFGERMVLPETAGWRLPDSVGFAEGALVEPMACGRRALKIAGLKTGDRLLVLGAGNMAISAIYWARLLGAGRIVVATRSAKRDDLAQAMGADAVLRLDNQDPAVIETALGGLPDIVVEAIGKPGMLQMAIDRASLGGTVVSMGMCTTPDPIIPALGAFKGLSVHFPLGYAIEDFTETIRAFDAGTADPAAMISDTIGLDGLSGMLDELRGPNHHLKVQVDPHLECAPD